MMLEDIDKLCVLPDIIMTRAISSFAKLLWSLVYVRSLLEFNSVILFGLHSPRVKQDINFIENNISTPVY